MNVTNIVNFLVLAWPYITAGLGVSVVTQILKRLVGLENSAVIRFLFYTVSVLTALTGYLVVNHAISSGVVGLNAAGLTGLATFFHPFVSGTESFLVRLNKALATVNQDAPKVETAVNDAAKGEPVPPANF